MLACACLFLSSLPRAAADVRLPRVLGSNMVLQCDMAAPVWGWAAAGEEVSVAIAGQEVKTRANAQGRWQVKLAPTPAGGPHEMVVRGKNEIRLDNILFGDVWLCSGQSNMRWELLSSTTGKQALAQADLPQMRLFRAPLRSSGQPVEDVAADWKVCSATTAARFSAVGFFFGRELNRELGVPIGLIDSAWSGSRIDAWIAPEGFASIPGYPDMTRRLDALRERWKAELLPWAIQKGPEAAAMREALEKGTPLPITPEWPLDSTEMNRRHQYTAGRETEVYNGMIYPLVPFGLRGVIWYQGESNTRAWPLIDYALPDGNLTYVDKTRALIAGWQKVWGQGEFPLYFVLICPF
jgi:sialate O-acetylesterase